MTDVSTLTLPPLRGQVANNVSLAPYSWFRVGGPADLFFAPEDEEDLSQFLKAFRLLLPHLF